MLAGGAGRRMAAGRACAGSKPAALLAGRPLVSYALAALARACPRVAVVCKRDTELPATPEAERWEEPDEPRHPLTGLVHALERAGGPVLVCAADMPFVTAEACRALIEAAFADEEPGESRVVAGRAPAVVAESAGRLEPLLGIYHPRAGAHLRAASGRGALRDAVGGLGPARVRLPERVVRSVNTPEDLRAAEAELAAMR